MDQPTSPSALVNLFANAMPMRFMEQAHRVRGEYVPGKGVSYQGMFYDTLKDEISDGSISLIVPGVIRGQLSTGQVIEVVGYLNRRVSSLGARIELQLTVTELVSQDAKTVDESQLKQFEVLQEKANAGYRDVDGMIKAAVLEDRRITIEVIIGKSAIIDQDITHQLQDATGFYDLRFNRITLTNERELIEAMRRSDADIVVVSRGGGERIEIFEQVAVAETALQLEPLFVTAIGHTQDVPLLQKVADKAFITPTAFGQYLNDMYNRTVEEKSRSKGRAVEEATRHLKGLYEKQLQNEREAARMAKEALLAQEQLHARELALARETVKETVVIKRLPSAGWVMLIATVALAIGGLLVYLYFRQMR